MTKKTTKTKGRKASKVTQKKEVNLDSIIITKGSGTTLVSEPMIEKKEEEKNWNNLVNPKVLIITEEGGELIPLKELERLGKLKGIISQETIVHSCSPMYAAVTVKVVFSNGTTYCGSADAGKHNVDGNFALYSLPMAENRALARALRFGLNITLCSLEEVSKKTIEGGFSDEDGPIKSSSERCILEICNRKGIKIDKVLSLGSRKVARIDQLTQKEATNIIKALNNGAAEKLLISA